MPLYEYQCARCGRFERIQKFADPPLLACPTCGGEVQKVLSAPAIQFKGTGWYITDYARKSTGQEAGKSGESKSAEGAKASGGKDGASSTEPSTKTDTAAKAASGGSGSKGSTGGSTS